ncbi:MAG: hypothetical protein COB88_01250 [Flavobacteriales bacterium]|nr:MAG: hypothetical protein COB88_01250 [Flavobacteriales bacterium]
MRGKKALYFRVYLANSLNRLSRAGISFVTKFYLLLIAIVRIMNISSAGQLTRSNCLLKSIILLALILNPLVNLAQVSKSALKKLQKEESFKIVTLAVYGVASANEATLLETRLEALTEVSNCEVDYLNNKCTVIAGFTVRKEDILGITGRSGIKTSDYTEEIRWQSTPPAKRNIQYATELEKADQVNDVGSRQKKTELELERRKTVEIEEIERAELRKIEDHISHGLPHDYPKYEDTGDRSEDKRKYTEAKGEWIRNNPEKYKALFSKDGDGVTVIPLSDFDRMSGKKQQYIKDNPSKFKITEQKR